MNCKKLIEVAMPIKEISAESVQDKYIHHGHISTLHIWWARRPLPVCRAVVFASLVPDPLDENCPQAFKDAVELLLGKESNKNQGDPYKPYDNIPWTSVIDPMEDNLRNRLMMFIGKFSPIYIENEIKGKTTNAKDQLSNYSLIKWDNKNNEEIINKTRKLIWVAHNSPLEYPERITEGNGDKGGLTAESLLNDFDTHYQAIKQTEQDLYCIPDRHIETDEVKQKQTALQKSIDAFLDKMPKVFDPFAGGGAIPLESARLGCRTYGNDINPVAHIIQKGSVEFPQKFGKPITFSKHAFIEKYGQEALNNINNTWKGFNNGELTHINIPNCLSFDVEYYAKKLLKLTEEDIGHFYPSDEKGNKPIAYLWARIGKCSNPSCGAEVPLLRDFYIVNKPNKKIYLNPIINNNTIEFEHKSGKHEIDGWLNRANLNCPCCNNITDANQLKQQIGLNKYNSKILVTIWEDKDGKYYKLPTEADREINIDEELLDIPQEKLPKALTGGAIMSWNFELWAEMFSPRQLLALQTLTKNLNLLKKELDAYNNDYYKAIIVYLSILIDRIASYNTSFGRWIAQNQQLTSVFGRQSIAMIFDYPEIKILR